MYNLGAARLEHESDKASKSFVSNFKLLVWGDKEKLLELKLKRNVVKIEAVKVLQCYEKSTAAKLLLYRRRKLNLKRLIKRISEGNALFF